MQAFNNAAALAQQQAGVSLETPTTYAQTTYDANGTPTTVQVPTTSTGQMAKDLGYTYEKLPLTFGQHLLNGPLQAASVAFGGPLAGYLGAFGAGGSAAGSLAGYEAMMSPTLGALGSAVGNTFAGAGSDYLNAGINSQYGLLGNALTTSADWPYMGYAAGTNGLGSIGSNALTLGANGALSSATSDPTWWDSLKNYFSPSTPSTGDGTNAGTNAGTNTANPLSWGSLASVLGGAALGALTGGTSEGGTQTTTREMDPRAWQYSQPALQAGLSMLPAQMSYVNGLQGQATSTLGQLMNAPNLSSNPWVQQYADALASDAWKDWSTRGAPALASQFSGAGRYGSGAYGLAQGQAAGDVSRGITTSTAGLFNNAYGQGLNAAGQALSMTPSIAQLGWLPLNQYSNLIGSVPWGNTTTEQQPSTYSDPWAGALGGALTGAGLWRNLTGARA
jgi:hypothetical protein